MTLRRPDYSEPFFYDRDRSNPRNHVWKEIEQRFPPPRGLKRGEDISVASWNLNCTSRHASERVWHALYLLQSHYHKYYKPYDNKSHFMPQTTLRLVVLFQGINRAGFQVILDSPFVQDNFFLSDSHIYTDDVRQSTVTMISKDLPISKVFRIPFRHTRNNRDCLFVDIAIQNEARSRISSTAPPRPGVPFHDVIRIANTELENIGDQGALVRSYQLGVIQEFLSPEDPQMNMEVIVVGGVLGASMGLGGPENHHLPRLFGLRDLWSEQNPTVDDFAPFDVERERIMDKGKRLGHTWGYQPVTPYLPPGRFDKILASGSVSAGKVMRIGVGYKLTIPSPNESKTSYGAARGPGEVIYTSTHSGLNVQVNVPPTHRIQSRQLTLPAP